MLNSDASDRPWNLVVVTVRYGSVVDVFSRVSSSTPPVAYLRRTPTHHRVVKRLF